MNCKYCHAPTDGKRFCGKRCMERWVQANPTLTIGYGMFTEVPLVEWHGPQQTISSAQERQDSFRLMVESGEKTRDIGKKFGLSTAQVRKRVYAAQRRQETSCSHATP